MLSSLPAILLLFYLPLIPARPFPTTARSPAHEKHQITVRPHPFENLLGAEPGSHVSGMSDLKRLLSGSDYLPGNSNPNFTATPRCGVDHFAFFPGQPRWAHRTPMTLSYALSPTATISYLTREQIMTVLRRAFQRWARVIPVSFVEADEYDVADVKVGFYGGDHGDGEPFDGVLGVLAHAFSPESGRLHLDIAETWAVDFGDVASDVAVDLESVMTHEIGHVLGLAHSLVKDAIMYPSLSPRTRKVDLRADDVEGVQALYGSNPSFSFSSLIESDTSAASGLGRGRVGRICWIIWISWVTMVWMVFY